MAGFYVEKDSTFASKFFTCGLLPSHFGKLIIIFANIDNPMTPNEVIYNIKQDPLFSEIWSELSREEKEDIVKRMETQKPIDLEKVMLEIKTGQNRLF